MVAKRFGLWYSLVMKKKSDQSARQLKSAGITIRRNPREDHVIEKRIPGADKVRIKAKHEQALSMQPVEILAMARDKAAGRTNQELADKYAVSVGYVQDSLRQMFLKSSLGREILKGVILDNAVAAGMQARERMAELSPMQSVLATGIFTQRFIDMDKHDKDIPKEVDLSELMAVGRMLTGLQDSITLPSEGKMIDVGGVDRDD